MLRINIKSFQWSYIQKTIFKINEIVSFLKLCNTKVIGLPVKKKYIRF